MKSRTIVGDSLTFMPGLQRESFDVIFADAPFRTLRPNRSRDMVAKNLMGGWRDWNTQPLDTYVQFTRQWVYEANRLLKPGGAFWITTYVGEDFGGLADLALILRELRLNFVKQIVWRRHPSDQPKYPGNPLRGVAHYLLWVTKGHASSSCRPLAEDWTDVWDLSPEEPYATSHPLPLPVELLYRVLTLSCPPNGHVLDPFFGVGSTGIAANKLGLTWTGIDINATYIEEFWKRLEVCQTAHAD